MDVRDNCRTILCPVCGKAKLRKHGWRWGYIDGLLVIICWRLYCDPRYGGCGHTPCLRLCSILKGRALSAKVLALFIKALVEGSSIRAAWDCCKAVGCLRTGYRTYHWLKHNQSNIRNALHEFIDVRGMNTDGSSFIALLKLFDQAFRGYNIAAFQLKLQKDFASP